MPNKRKSDGGGLGPHVRALRAGRTDFDPGVLRVVMQFMVMLNARYTEAHRTAASRADGVNASIRQGICRRYSQLADAAMVFAQDAACPWSRVQWHKAGAMLDQWCQDAAARGELPPTA